MLSTFLFSGVKGKKLSPLNFHNSFGDQQIGSSFFFFFLLFRLYFLPLCFVSLFGCWPKKISDSLASHLAFCALKNVRAIHGSDRKPHCQNTFSPLPYRFSVCKAASFCPSNMQNPSLPYSNDYSLLPPFYVVPFRMDDASKQVWHIKRSHVPPADLHWKICNLYIYHALKQQCSSSFLHFCSFKKEKSVTRFIVALTLLIVFSDNFFLACVCACSVFVLVCLCCVCLLLSQQENMTFKWSSEGKNKL